MAKSNIDKFDEITGMLFAKLFSSFPEPVDIRLEDYVPEEDIAPLEHIDPWILEEARCEFVAHSIRWLIESGYITIFNFNNDGHVFYGVVLTAKGLECLKMTPDSLRPSAGTQLAAAASSGSMEVLKSVVNQVLGAGISIAMQRVVMS
ncbi:hypothetical protein [Klebsiella quasivariicola]|uniref:hypothetical protein n=1 Tax=Klebsiella quasivariicola TaxID=2026240 RepID=UPI00247AD597|nr:hypothetical protein [Klebsiella quasivariicola]